METTSDRIAPAQVWVTFGLLEQKVKDFFLDMLWSLIEDTQTADLLVLKVFPVEAKASIS
jgi:hypothetical protein